MTTMTIQLLRRSCRSSRNASWSLLQCHRPAQPRRVHYSALNGSPVVGSSQDVERPTRSHGASILTRKISNSSNNKNRIGTFQGLRPFRINLGTLCADDDDRTSVTRTTVNPLLVMQQAAVERGIANAQGYRLQGAPWAFSLAEIQSVSSTSSSAPSSNQSKDNHATTTRCNDDTNATLTCWPSVRTIGFQRISESGLD